MTPLWVLVLLIWVGFASLIHVRLEQDGRMREHSGLALLCCLLWPLMLIAEPVAEAIAQRIYLIRVRWFTWRLERELRRLISKTPSTVLADPDRALVFRNIHDVVEALLDGRAPELEELLEDDEAQHGDD